MLTPEEFNVILERIRNGTASAEDKDAYHRSLQQSAEAGQIGLPTEPTTFNIGKVEGKDIQFGDRITIEQILGQKVIYVSVEEIKTREFQQTSPYKGLKKFEPEDKDRFFGRDQFIKDLANELEQTNLILLLGASGSGKSSVVRAGLLSWLSKKWGSRLVSLTFTPDQDPFESLYASLLRYYKQAEAQVAREGREDTLTQIVTTLRQRDAYWFIFIDQFEELFTTSQADKRDRFITGLAQLNTALKLLGSPQACPVKVMATMRADFLDRLSPYPALVKATNQHRPMIAEMQLDELRQAIEQPAAQQGVVFEMGLVEEIIKDVQGQAGYLPLLQYTLNLVWETEVQNGSIHDRTLNISTYRALGGVRGALQKHVSQIYEALPEAERLAAQRVFLKLVEIGGDEESGTEWKPVRRRAARSEFDTELERRVLVRLIDENLLVSDQQPQAQASTVEIAHEALLTSWETLNTWIKENRQTIALRNRLNDDVARWQAKKAEDELWTGSKLEQVLELKKNPTFNQVMGGFSTTANQFIDTSLGLRDRQLRRARAVAGIGVTLAVLAGVGTLFAGYQLQQATQQRMEQYAATSKTLLDVNSTEGLVYAINAVGLSRSPLVRFPNHPTPQSVQKSMFEAIQASQDQRILQVSGANIKAVSFSPDGQHIVTGSDDGKVRLWNLQGNQIGETIQVSNKRGEQISVAFSPDGQQILTSSRGGIVQVWNLTGALIRDFKLPKSIGPAMQFSPDGQYIISDQDRDGKVYLWNLQKDSIGNKSQDSDGSTWELLQVLGDGSAYAEFSKDGKQIIGGYANTDSIYLWNLGDGLTKKSLAVAESRVTVATISPAKQSIVTGSKDGKLHLWNLEGRMFAKTSQGHVDHVKSIAFSLDGQRIVSGSEDGTVRLWDTELHSIREPFQGNGVGVAFVAFSPNGEYVISRSEDGVVSLWNLQDRLLEEKFENPYLPGGTTKLKSITFSSDGKHLLINASNSDYGTELLSFSWNLRGQQESQSSTDVSEINTNNHTRISFSPNGQRIATIGRDNKVHLWTVSVDNWLRLACDRLRYHPILTKPETDVAREAKATCEQYVWANNQPSETPIAEVSASPQAEELAKPAKPPEVTPALVASQPSPTPAKPTPAPTVSPSPSSSSSSYKFKFPQASCGDPTAKPGSAFPVFIDNQPVEEIRKKYCADAYSVSNRQKTGKPSVQVASFSDRQKAEAFAKEVGGEVGEP